MNPVPGSAIAHLRRALRVVSVSAFISCLALSSYAADSVVQVQLDTKNATPRAVESLTERGILRDYRFAWTSIAQAVELNTADPLEGPFAGEAKRLLRETVVSQQRSGLSRQYVNQSHRLEAVFYAPEGDVIELHDTAEYEIRISDGGKIIHDEHVVMHFVVLMTPGADRWVIRQLQAVPKS
ncbi:MAG: hypothetical protein JWQ87_1076 [Candidatus Sulfotelmatobacter sp.]|nr:hypothetical protein [Candidatus Sulfotelmatobacter sp.]